MSIQATAKTESVSKASALAAESSVGLSEKPVAGVYWPQLDGLRALAFLLVFMHHLGAIAASERIVFPLSALLYRTLDIIHTWGWIGVDIFFSLSGFLITHLLISEKDKFGNISFKNFFARRALRIWPAYYLVISFACLAVPMMQWQQLNWPLFAEFLVKQGLPLTFFIGNYSMVFGMNVLLKFTTGLALPVVFLLVPLWSLAVEEQFYMTWPSLLKKLPDAKAIYRTIMALSLVSLAARAGLWYLSRYQIHLAFPVSLYYQCTFARLEPLMAGAFCAVSIFYFPAIVEQAKRYTPLLYLAMAAILALLVMALPDITYNTAYNIATFSVIGAGCLLLLATTLISPALARFFSNNILASFGRLTYAMYLVHYFAIALADKIWLMLPEASRAQLPSWPTKLTVALTITYVFAFLSWHLLERHVLKKRKLFNR